VAANYFSAKVDFSHGVWPLYSNVSRMPDNHKQNPRPEISRVF